MILSDKAVWNRQGSQGLDKWRIASSAVGLPGNQRSLESLLAFQSCRHASHSLLPIGPLMRMREMNVSLTVNWNLKFQWTLTELLLFLGRRLITSVQAGPAHYAGEQGNLGFTSQRWGEGNAAPPSPQAPGQSHSPQSEPCRGRCFCLYYRRAGQPSGIYWWICLGVGPGSGDWRPRG